MTARKTTKTSHPVLNEDAIHLVAARFRALGDPSRIRLLNLLMQSESSVQELVEASGMTQTNVSRHLGLLRREGVVVRKKEGKRAVYRIADPHVEELCLLVCGAIQTHLSEGLGALQGQGI